MSPHPLFLLSLSICAIFRACAGDQQVYIVSTDPAEKPALFPHAADWHSSLLSSPSTLLFQYKSAFHGFAALLTETEAELLQQKNGVVCLFPDSTLTLHTTRTPKFLHIAGSKAMTVTSGGKGVIIGVLDTGVWPESKSFDDRNMEPPPDRWKGSCNGGKNFTCNNKIIGARYFTGHSKVTEAAKTVRDTNGHGSHTASTIAGSPVDGANLFGYANGTARGMAPESWLAIYKVCTHRHGCTSSRVLAGMDAAIEDGVDIISLSLGDNRVLKFYEDPIAIGSFVAVQRGVIVAASANNNGPRSKSVSNYAPWLFTVAASSLDRSFPGLVTLGNGKTFTGTSIYSGSGIASGQHLPLITGRDAVAENGDPDFAAQCYPSDLNASTVKGKIVVCEGMDNGPFKAFSVKDAGGTGIIIIKSKDPNISFSNDVHPLPSVIVDSDDGSEIKKYVSLHATASIRSLGTALGVKPAPIVATFSSRGPSPVSPEILKPDITAPGVDILAAWSTATSPTLLREDPRRVAFNIDSGTSMSCPHVSGIVALIKTAHPTWTPSAIRSALMTSATVVANDGERIRNEESGRPSTPFDFGAGHVEPASALDPGLVYDLSADDYMMFVCSLNYTKSHLRRFMGASPAKCASLGPWRVEDFNYPSFSVLVKSGQTVYNYSRVLTNVAAGGSVYRATVEKEGGAGVSIKVEPELLSFLKSGEKRSYRVVFVVSPGMPSTTAFASLVWSDGSHHVRSPIAITPVS